MATPRVAGLGGGAAIRSPRPAPPGGAPHRHAATRAAATQRQSASRVWSPC